MSGAGRWRARLVLALVPVVAAAALLKSLDAFFGQVLFLTVARGAPQDGGGGGAGPVWHAPKRGRINSLDAALGDAGVYGFIFNSSRSPAGVEYATYNYCNMPHVRRREYAPLPSAYKLRYVEVIHRHHKRTPYAANLFPRETDAWDCTDAAVFQFASPYPHGNRSAQTHLRAANASLNPFDAPGGRGSSCAFPQMSRGGLDDAWEHGRDLYGVYHDALGLIPDDALARGAVRFRVTNNALTAQVAGMVVSGMFGGGGGEGGARVPVPLDVQDAAIDSLEPGYACPAAAELGATFGVGSESRAWTAHLEASRDLFRALDGASGVAREAEAWHRSWDHYFDNLSSRTCHEMPLPANVTLAQAEKVFRLGLYEYSFLYRDARESLDVARAAFGVWLAELAQHLDDVRRGREGRVVYRHNVAHDGSLAMLLALLQVDAMVWPGTGAEVVFELYERQGAPKGVPADGDMDDGWFLRALWGGRVLSSSYPGFGRMERVPLAAFLAYADAMVGKRAAKVPALCSAAAEPH